MNRKLLILLFGGSFIAYYFYSKSQGGGVVTDTVDKVTDSIKSAIVGWKNVGSAATWLPYLAQAELQYNLPTDLLSRIAYQESHFREDIIRGNKLSSAGAEGLMQLEPAYYASVNVARPYTDADVITQINDAAKEMVHLYQRFSSWPLAIAAYNAGEGTVHKYAGIPPFKETQDYVNQITADVPSVQVA